MKSRTAAILGMHVPFLGRSKYFSSTFQTLYHRLTSVSVSVERWTLDAARRRYPRRYGHVATIHRFGILVFHYRYTNIPRDGMLYLEFLPNTNVEEVEGI
jgi:hypothetical protein